jgi:hypothetical protein
MTCVHVLPGHNAELSGLGSSCCQHGGEEAHRAWCIPVPIYAQTQYYYIKGWTSSRTNSLLFDQPGAHHNPQRDPFPSEQWTAQDASASGFHLSPTLLATLRGTWHPLKWSYGAVPMPLTWFEYVHPCDKPCGSYQ